MVAGEAFLEIGIGGGGNIRRVLQKFGLVVGTDLSRESIEDSNRVNAELILADRATCFRAGSFDAIVFNPPYVPSDAVVDKAVDGGPDGMQIPLSFLSSALQAIKPEGTILMLISSLGAVDKLEAFCKLANLKLTRVAEKRLFYESLIVYAITKIRPKSHSS
ncbi:MAG: hypothetical protein M1368_12630 [Thaumarchaeota archaeon]|nr:hypothetical protein [Nitrososphaerota archaeon]MDG6994831.1 hypothetical protein [Nitrososphaerota archaeon]